MEEIVKNKINKKESKNLHKDHRKRLKEKFLKSEFDNFAEHEILEFLLFYSIPLGDTNPLAHKLIDKYHSLSAVLDATFDNLTKNEGIGTHSAILLKMIPAILHVYKKQKANEINAIDNQLIAFNYASNLFIGCGKEEFYVICLDPSNRIVESKRFTSGQFNKVEINLKDITQFVLNNNCDRIILTHNHVAAQPKPSTEDIDLTTKLFNSCVLNDIDIVDHIVYSPLGMFSFTQNGIMQEIKQEVMRMLNYAKTSETYKKFSTSYKTYLVEK